MLNRVLKACLELAESPCLSAFPPFPTPVDQKSSRPAPGVDPITSARFVNQPPPTIFKFFAIFDVFPTRPRKLTSNNANLRVLTPATARIPSFKVPDITGVYTESNPVFTLGRTQLATDRINTWATGDFYG